MTNEQPRLTIDKRSPALWAVTFANPPINLIDAAMVGELQQLLTAAETDDRLAVIVLDSADPEFFLAHWDIADPALTNATGRPVPDGRPYISIRRERAGVENWDGHSFRFSKSPVRPGCA